MIRTLQIRNLALFGALSVEFGRGLTVLTGETGAGKSLIIDALSLLVGARATPSIVRSGSEKASVEALFEISPGCEAARRLTGLGLDPVEPADEVILRRDVMISGRGRTSINGHLVPSTHLLAVSSALLELSSQHEQHTLLLAGSQRDFFDGFAQLTSLRDRVKASYDKCRAAMTERESLSTNERGREQRRDFLRYQVDELESLGLQPGEQDGLNKERVRLAHVEQLIQLGATAQGALSEAPAGESAALDLVGTALHGCEQMAAHDAALGPIVEALQEAQARLADAGYELARYLSSLEPDPARLEEIGDRLDALNKALRKHGPSIEEALGRLSVMKTELESLDNFESALAEADRAVNAARAELKAAAEELRDGRARAKNKFLKPLTSLLKDFSMPKVRVDLSSKPVTSGIAVDDAGTLCGAAGFDDVEILFSANEGEPLHPLAKVASGGELSRVMLALRTLEAERGNIPLLVFDEIDAGVSGAAARRVAERLSALGERCQILCVTHNPTIAAAADHHLIIEKQERNGRTESTVFLAEGIKRQAELARLLDGGKQTAKGLALAAEMLEVG